MGKSEKTTVLELVRKKMYSFKPGLYLLYSYQYPLSVSVGSLLIYSIGLQIGGKIRKKGWRNLNNYTSKMLVSTRI